MENYEVVVVGGGPAGSTCAGLLAKQGFSVLLLDKELFPREKPCAGWVTPEVFGLLEISPDRYVKRHLLQSFTAFRTGPMFGAEIETFYGRTVSYGIRRGEFDDFLLKKCTAAKSLGEPVTSLEKVSGGWVINGRIRAALLVGAGGHHCPVARVLGAKPSKEHPVAALVSEIELTDEEWSDCRLTAEVAALSFTDDLRGYGWVLRKGGVLNVGLGSTEPDRLKEKAAAYLAHVAKQYHLPGRIGQGLRGHAYLTFQGKKGRRVVDDGALLIGDAAGLSRPESGEGILPAVESALMATRVIGDARGDYQRERLEPYAVALNEHLGRGIGRSFWLPEGLRRAAGGYILSHKKLTRRLLLDRWFLHDNLKSPAWDAIRDFVPARPPQVEEAQVPP